MCAMTDCKHDLRLQQAPVCPHCGHIESDAWEFDFGPGLEGDGVFCCGSCDEEYNCSREVTTYYTTSKVKK